VEYAQTKNAIKRRNTQHNTTQHNRQEQLKSSTMTTVLIHHSVLVTILLLAIFISCSLAAKEPRTGIHFPDRYGYMGSRLDSWGVRTNGPFKVYGVGKYDHTFLLKMCRGVGGEDISNSIAAALKPRGCLEETIGEFQELLLKGLPNGATKGTCLAFGTATGKLSITVDDKYIGTIPSESLAQAFFKIYTDSNAVCDLKPVVGGTDGLQLLKAELIYIRSLLWVCFGSLLGHWLS
jgi:hypothetical protein